jgi:NAD+ diphosphatase
MRFVPHSVESARRTLRTWFVVHAKGVVARRAEGDRPALQFPSDEDVARLGLSVDHGHRLGVLDDTDALAIPFDGPVPSPFEVFGFRELAALVDAELFGVVGRAFHTCDWLTTHRFCGRCGARTEPLPKERCLVCPRCALHSYPRISPAIITLVRRGGQALLASNAKFPGALYSTLAGFADIGESLEETLVREVEEEVGVKVKNVRYFGSQPWPFPNSLMIAFTAEWASGEIAVDGVEISDAKWFTADALPMIPPPLSIARRLIDAWVAEVSSR